MTAPDRTPDTVFICTHVGEYGHYYPEAAEAEGEHGGEAVAYTRATPAATDPKVKALVEAAKPFADIGVGSDPDYQAVVRIDRDAVIALRAALDAMREGGDNG